MFFRFVLFFCLGKILWWENLVLLLTSARTTGTADLGPCQWLRAKRDIGDEPEGEEPANPGLGGERAGSWPLMICF